MGKPHYENASIVPLIGAFAGELGIDPNRALAVLQAHAPGVIAVLLETKTPAELRALIAGPKGGDS